MSIVLSLRALSPLSLPLSLDIGTTVARLTLPPDLRHGPHTIVRLSALLLQRHAADHIFNALGLGQRRVAERQLRARAALGARHVVGDAVTNTGRLEGQHAIGVAAVLGVLARERVRARALHLMAFLRRGRGDRGVREGVAAVALLAELDTEDVVLAREALGEARAGAVLEGVLASTAGDLCDGRVYVRGLVRDVGREMAGEEGNTELDRDY